MCQVTCILASASHVTVMATLMTVILLQDSAWWVMIYKIDITWNLIGVQGIMHFQSAAFDTNKLLLIWTRKHLLDLFVYRTVLTTLLGFIVRSVWMVSMVMPLMELLATARNVHARVREQQREYALLKYTRTSTENNYNVQERHWCKIMSPEKVHVLLTKQVTACLGKRVADL